MITCFPGIQINPFPKPRHGLWFKSGTICRSLYYLLFFSSSGRLGSFQPLVRHIVQADLEYHSQNLDNEERN